MISGIARKFSFFLLLFLLVLSVTTAQTILTYDLKNNFSEQNNLAVPLNVLGTGAFTADSLPGVSCLNRTVYGFTQNSGLQFDNGASGNIIGNSYTIESYFKFSSNTGLIRLIDYKNRTSDSGLYASSTEFFFSNEVSVNTNIFVPDEYIHMVITRNGISKNVGMYLNGMLMATFVDTNMSALPDAAQVINFFQDDLISGNEARPGNIALLKFYSYDLDSNQVLQRFSHLKQSVGAMAIQPDTLGTCFNGNVFNFTNSSQPVVPLSYSWEFGDGNTGSGSPVTHSYNSPGIYTVYLIGDDGNGCIDSAEVNVNAYTDIPFDLGQDFGICNNEQALIDAGNGFASYLWSDSSTAQMLIANQPGTYSVTVTDSSGCSGSDSIVVLLNPDPIFDLGSDTVICYNTTLILNAPDSMESYLWNTGSVNNFIAINASGTFSVEITNFEGCSASDTIVVTENPDIIISLGNDTTICDGQSLMLDAGAGFLGYQWNIGATTQSINVIATAQYVVTVTDSIGCTKSDDIFVNVLPTTVVDLGPDVNLCGGDSLVLDAGPGFLSYLWDDGSTSQTLTVYSGGTYAVTVSNGFDCDGTDSIIVYTTPFLTLGADFSVCPGDSVLLDPGLIYNTYLWSTGATTSTILVPTPGVYTLTVTDINGCTNSDEIELTNSPMPVPLIPDSLQICNGDTVILDAGSGFINFLWNDGATTQTINVFAAGVYTVTVTDLLGCTGSGDLILGLLPMPVVDLGNDTILCAGDSVVLNGGAGFSSYLWDSGFTGQFLSVALAGNYSIIVTDTAGCSGTDSIFVDFYQTPVVNLGPDTTLCFGDSLLLDAGAGFTSYSWNDGSSSQSYYASFQGTHNVTVTDGNGCSGFDSIQVDFFAPVTMPVINQIGNNLMSSSPSGNQWYIVPGGIIPGATSQLYTPPANGTYYVIVTDSNGCMSSPSPDFIFIMSGISESGNLEFTVFPNPSSGKIQLRYPSTLDSNYDIHILDISGKIIYRKKFAGEHIVSIDMSGFMDGIYFVQVITDDSIGIKRILLNRK